MIAAAKDNATRQFLATLGALLINGGLGTVHTFFRLYVAPLAASQQEITHKT